jgi:hypothetical protein
VVGKQTGLATAKGNRRPDQEGELQSWAYAAPISAVA